MLLLLFAQWLRSTRRPHDLTPTNQLGGNQGRREIKKVHMTVNKLTISIDQTPIQCYWIVLYIVHVTAFCLGGGAFFRTRCRSGWVCTTRKSAKSPLVCLIGIFSRCIWRHHITRKCLFFLPARRYASAGLCDSDVSVRPSICLSVCHTPVLCLAERKQDREMYTSW